jgi:anti-sigma factor RsiW
MSCSPTDLKDYLFGELEPARRAQLEAHVGECRPCREELDRLRLTEAALHALPEEEPPRRIAFVSDKVFEPRWWHAWRQSGPRLAFAGAAMLSVAILVHGFVRPPVVMAPAGHAEAAAIEARVNAEVARRIETALQAAVAESEQRQAKKAGEMVEAVRRDVEFQRRADRVAFEEAFTVLQKKYNNVLMLASSEPGGRP